MRPLHHHLGAGSDPGAVPLPGAAQFPAALQRRADAADPDRAARGGRAPFRAGALGPAAVLGEGPEDLHAADQRARRERHRQAGLPRRHEAPALPDPGRRLLRMEGGGRPQAALFRAAEVGRADGLRRPVGMLDRAERRGTGDRGHRHHRGQPHARRNPRPHAGDRWPPEAFDLWLNCARCRRHDRGGADRARARESARALSGVARGQPHRQRQSEAGGAGRRRCGAGASAAETAGARASGRRKRRTAGRGRCSNCATGPCPD